MRIYWIIGIISLVLASGCGKPAGQAGMTRPPASVAVAVAQARDVPSYLEEIGRSEAREVVTVRPQVSGRVTELHFTDGAMVKRGAPLFTIDPRPFQAALDSARAAYEQNRAVLGLAKVEAVRYRGLSAKGGVSHEELDQKENAVQVAEAQGGASLAAIETAKLNLDYCAICSPIDGRAGQRLVDAGNIVKANETALVTLQRLDPIYADFTIAENDLLAVQKSMRAGPLKVEVRLPDAPGDVRTGELTFLDTSVEEGTGTVRLRATVPNADAHIWPGRFVKVRLILDVTKGAVLVPAEAVGLSAKGPFVYTVKSDSTAELRPIVQGQRHGELVVVREGVKAGERVVTQGQLAVAPGGRVKVVETAR